MPRKRKITIEALTELGAHKLAELLIAEATRNRKLKQAIDLAMSSKDGPIALEAAVRKRLAGFVESRSMPSYERGREIIVELDGPARDDRRKYWRRKSSACARPALGAHRIAPLDPGVHRR